MSSDKDHGPADKGDAHMQTPQDIERLQKNAAAMVEESGRIMAAVTRAKERDVAASLAPDESADLIKTIGAVAQHWLSDPQKAVAVQNQLTGSLMALFTETMRAMAGEQAAPVAEADPRDKRFVDKEWTENPYFNFLKQAYLVTSRWAEDAVAKAEGLDPHVQKKAAFYMRQVTAALSPSNFLGTNPELIRATVEEGGENLVRGMRMLAEDIEIGKGELKLRQTSSGNFELGKNLATTAGKVIFRNKLMELIQYAPQTSEVLAKPILICPPWINKFYILDLTAEKSFINWMVAQGLTVFVISWVNPDERHRALDWNDYMQKGILKAATIACDITGEKSVHAIGYCVGGTLLAATLAYLGANKDKRISDATLLTTQVDFTHAGDLKVYADETQIKAIEDIMAKFGYLPGGKMAAAFNMLRPLDLIWPYMVNTYMKGISPQPFDLLFWNADSTRMAEANHRFYLRNCYLENKLAKGEMEIGGERISLSKVRAPIYNLAAKEDHIAPALSVFKGSAQFGSDVTYVLAGSGHIAGVVNPPAKGKYQFWTGDAAKGEFSDWLANATETPGSWWPHWVAWLKAKDPRMVKARKPGSKAYEALADAPGAYVRVSA
jgi:polyhydroxyalkanoate synthase subunit PhaC